LFADLVQGIARRFSCYIYYVAMALYTCYTVCETVGSVVNECIQNKHGYLLLLMYNYKV